MGLDLLGPTRQMQENAQLNAEAAPCVFALLGGRREPSQLRALSGIRNATLEVDGAALVKDGKLTAGTVVAGR
jgi:hypothetical protein